MNGSPAVTPGLMQGGTCNGHCKGWGKSGSQRPFVNAGWWGCARQMYEGEGAMAFTRGLGTTLSRAFIVNAVLFSSYEAALQALSGHDPANAA